MPALLIARKGLWAPKRVPCCLAGDMGRTQPSLGDLLGGLQAQIAYLDVTDIHMDFLG
jgi:hypothetical protein